VVVVVRGLVRRILGGTRRREVRERGDGRDSTLVLFSVRGIVRFVVRREDSERTVEDLATQRRRVGLEAFAGVLQRVQAVLRSLGDLGVRAGDRGSRQVFRSFVREGDDG
tara:strand:- start:924 stop:1253 length:330 start_codon:yes stop_codon:yes gene_type:complete